MFRFPYPPKRSSGRKEFIESNHSSGIQHEQSADRRSNTADDRNFGSQADERDNQDKQLDPRQRGVESRSPGKQDRSKKRRDAEIWDEKTQNLVRKELEEDTILRREHPRRHLHELKIACQCAYFAMKFSLCCFRPFVVNVSSGLQHRPVALTNDR